MENVIQVPVEERRVRSEDGTEIAYFVSGRGRNHLVLAPGLGTHLYCWKYILEGFHDRYRMITWDPRGTYRSGRPSDLRHVRIQDHVRDLSAIRKAEGLDRFVLGGWSMGVQIALEHAHQFPDTVKALVLINGPYKNLFDTAMRVPFGGRLFPPVVRALQVLDPAFRPLAAFALSAPWAPRVLLATGLLATASNGQFFREIMREFARLDWKTYFALMLALNDHSAEAYLPGIRVPALITAGTRDYMTPVQSAREMQRGIRGSELVILPGATHYAMMEYPDELHRVMAEFLGRVEGSQLTVGS